MNVRMPQFDFVITFPDGKKINIPHAEIRDTSKFAIASYFLPTQKDEAEYTAAMKRIDETPYDPWFGDEDREDDEERASRFLRGRFGEDHVLFPNGLKDAGEK